MYEREYSTKCFYCFVLFGIRTLWIDLGGPRWVLFLEWSVLISKIGARNTVYFLMLLLCSLERAFKSESYSYLRVANSALCRLLFSLLGFPRSSDLPTIYETYWVDQWTRFPIAATTLRTHYFSVNLSMWGRAGYFALLITLPDN